MRAALYLRVSTDEQATESHSLEAQRRACQEYAQRRGWHIAAEYADPGASGRTLRRPGLARLLADAGRQNRPFDVVLVHKLDRWSRSIRDTITSIDDLESDGVSFAVAGQNIDRTTPEGKLMMMMLAVFAETYIDNLRQETTKGKRERALKGLYNGSLMFGYRRVAHANGEAPKPPEPDPRCAKAVRAAFAKAERGETPRQIAQWLNERGHRTVGVWGARPFRQDTVRYMLKSRFYLGEVSYKGEWHKGKHAPLIPPETFAAVAKALRSRTHYRRGVKLSARAYPLRGLLMCESCRQNFTGWGRRDGARFYRDTARLKAVSCPHRTLYRADLLEGAVAQYIAGIKLPPDWAAQVESMVGELTGKRDTTAARKRLLERKHREQALFLNGDIDEAEYHRRRERTQRELAELELITSDYKPLAGVLIDFRRVWKAANENEREALLHTMLNRVYVKNGSIVAVEPKEPFYPLLVVSSGVTGASDGHPSSISQRPVAILSPGTWRKLR